MPLNIEEIDTHTKSLVDKLGEASGLSVTISCPTKSGMTVKYVSQSDNPNLKNIYQEGFVFSYVSSAAGLAFIAATSLAERKKIIDSLMTTTTDQKDAAALFAPNFEQKLDGIRKRGYAFVWGQLNGVVALAVPIVRENKAVGALSVRSSDTTLREKSMADLYLSPLIHAAREIASGLPGQS